LFQQSLNLDIEVDMANIGSMYQKFVL